MPESKPKSNPTEEVKDAGEAAPATPSTATTEKEQSPQSATSTAKPETAPPKPVLLESDYATDDAPVRNAHHAPVFESTEDGIPVSVHHLELDEVLEFTCEPGEFVLDAAERAGLDLPYSCRSGGCLVCAARRLEGETEMGEQYVLEEEHEAEGFTLLCCTTVAKPSRFLCHQEGEID